MLQELFNLTTKFHFALFLSLSLCSVSFCWVLMGLSCPNEPFLTLNCGIILFVLFNEK